MRKLLPIMLLALITGCQLPNDPSATVPKDTKTRIVFDTNDLLYTGGFGQAGLEGFTKRLRSDLVQDLADSGITNTTNSDADPQAATITVSFSSIETETAPSINIFLPAGALAAQKVRVKYTAALCSPSGKVLADWKHDVDDEYIDHLCSHIASDITKYLKKGYR